MSYGLKNAKATHQRLRDKIFRHQIDRSLQVYVDDMVVKSRSTIMLKTWARFSIKSINITCTTKCVFELGTIKFLGFMLTEIEANLDKYTTVLPMRSPQNLKEIQRSVARFTSLARFVSQLIERITSILKTMKK